jgi:hypothetical protein
VKEGEALEVIRAEDRGHLERPVVRALARMIVE